MIVPPIAPSIAELNTRLCAALGLDVHRICGFTLTVSGEHPPRLEVDLVPSETHDWASGLEAIAQEFQVVPVDWDAAEETQS